MNDLERRALLGVAGVGALAALSGAVRGAGPLNPPAGAVTGTGRTLDEVYNKIPAVGSADGRTPIPGGNAPVTISSPGSYVLTGPITGTGASGISIAADHVTLDLNGFSVSSAFTTGVGVAIAYGFKGITVRNGLISGFLSGVQVAGSAFNIVIEDLMVRDSKSIGVQVQSTLARGVVIRRCTIMDTGSTTTTSDGAVNVSGIASAGSGILIEQCVIERLFYNGAGGGTMRGIFLNGGTNQIVRGCSVTADNSSLAAPHAGIVMSVPITGIYKDNVVVGFATKFISGTDGGGNA